jgi:hypothetical protein
MNASMKPTRVVGFKIEGVDPSEVENLQKNLPDSGRNNNRFKYKRGIGPDTSYTRALALISQNQSSKPTSRCAVVQDRQKEEKVVAQAGRIISRAPSETVPVRNPSSRLNIYPMLEARRDRNLLKSEEELMIFSFKEPLVKNH